MEDSHRLSVASYGGEPTRKWQATIRGVAQQNKAKQTSAASAIAERISSRTSSDGGKEICHKCHLPRASHTHEGHASCVFVVMLYVVTYVLLG